MLYYLIHFIGGIDAVTYGPYADRLERKKAAEELVGENEDFLPDGEDDLLFDLDIGEDGAVLATEGYSRLEIIGLWLATHLSDQARWDDWKREHGER